MKNKIKLLLADDHPVVLSGLKNFLSKNKNFKILGAVNNGKEVVDKAVNLLPDIIIMDINMPIMDGLEATRKIRETIPDAKILIYTMYNNNEYIHKIFDIGAYGYITKDATLEELIFAINSIFQGKIFYNSYVSDSDFDKKKDCDNSLSKKLTLRENEILKMITEGMSNKEIAVKLNLSSRTVERHRENMKIKFNIRSTPELVKFAIEKRIVNFS